MHRRLAGLVIVVTLVFISGCSRKGAIDPKAPIIIISIDTLRSDHLPAYGYRKIETPAIDAFRNDSILFEHAYSECPLTLVSHASVFTGLLPADHGVRDNLGYQLNPKVKTIAEVLKAKSYATGGAVSAAVLQADTGIRRGFDFWDDNIDIDPSVFSIGRAQRSGEVTREAAQKWIEANASRPFLFFFHIYEPHTPYEPPEPFLSRYGATYDGEVAAADDVVGKFIAFLKEKDLYERSTIVLMSDHGEGLGDHGEQEHGVFLYRDTLQVPLMLKLPAESEKGKSVAAPVQLTDIFPTLAQPFGGTEKHGGVSLLDIAHRVFRGDRALYAETYYPRFHFAMSDLHSLISGTNHYIQAPRPELYDLAADPAEKKNVLPEQRRIYAALRDQIKPFVHPASAPAPVDEEQRQKLAALGYIGSTVTADATAELPDPKDNIATFSRMTGVFRAYHEKRYAAVVTLADELLGARPHMVDILGVKLKALESLGRREEAIATAKEALRLDPTSTSFAAGIATLSLAIGRLDEADQHARLTLKAAPHIGHRLLAEIAIQRKDFAAARKEATAGMEQGRERPAGLLLFGRIEQGEGHLEQALKRFDEAAAQLASQHRGPLPKLNYYRGDTLARMGEGDRAESAFKAEISAFPTDPDAYKNLILLVTVQGRTREATELIFGLEKAAPTVRSYVSIAGVLKMIGDRNGARFWAVRGLRRFPNDADLKRLARS